MKKLVLPVAGIAALAAAYVWYPYHALDRLAEAARTGNSDELAARVDWPSVQQGLKLDLDAVLAQAMATTDGQGPGSNLGRMMLRMLGPRVIEKAAADYATPKGLEKLVASGGEIDLYGAVATTAAAMAGGAPSVRAEETADAIPTDDDEPVEDANPIPDTDANGIAVRGAHFVGPRTMSFEFFDSFQPDRQPVAGLLRLDGLSWKLIRIEIPENAVSEPPQTAARPK